MNRHLHTHPLRSLALISIAFGLGLIGAMQWRAYQAQTHRHRQDADARLDRQFDYAIVNYLSETP